MNHLKATSSNGCPEIVKHPPMVVLSAVWGLANFCKTSDQKDGQRIMIFMIPGYSMDKLLANLASGQSLSIITYRRRGSYLGHNPPLVCPSSGFIKKTCELLTFYLDNPFSVFEPFLIKYSTSASGHRPVNWLLITTYDTRLISSVAFSTMCFPCYLTQQGSCLD